MTQLGLWEVILEGANKLHPSCIQVFYMKNLIVTVICPFEMLMWTHENSLHVLPDTGTIFRLLPLHIKTDKTDRTLLQGFGENWIENQ